MGWAARLPDWVRTALAQPFVDEPGGQMLYSTGSSHLLSAILTRRSGRSTLQLARDWLGPIEDFSIAAWERDPQGIYFGGNQMAMSPKSLLAFGELYRNSGRTAQGRALISPAWIEQSWRLRTHSRFTGDGYGYGWFNVTVDEYREGTLVIAVIDAKSRNMVWRGTASARTMPTSSLQEKRARMREATAAILAKFPPQGGQPR